jgi:citrate/tricarballylate utilization protein
MLDVNLLAEANRQFTVCNACRYCEGLCTVFPAMELRTAFTEGDVTYLSALCHDCRACVDACPFSPPHEFAIDISALMSTARTQTFEHYARPRALWRLLTRGATLAGLIVATAVFFLIVALATGNPHDLVRTHRAPGAFYDVIAYAWLVIPTLVVSILAAVAIGVGAWGLARETRGGVRLLANRRAVGQTMKDVLALTNLKGGGDGCRYPGDRRSSVRRYLHHAVFYGFGLMFASTVSAAVEQELFARNPPYPLLSVPVLLGTIGGISTLAGCAGFFVFGVRSRDPSRAPESRRLDRLFTTMLMLATATGLLLLTLRSSPLMGAALITHLGVLGGLYVTFPYSKFVHAGYRSVALLRSHVEGGSKPHEPAEPPRETAHADELADLLDAHV